MEVMVEEKVTVLGNRLGEGGAVGATEVEQEVEGGGGVRAQTQTQEELVVGEEWEVGEEGLQTQMGKDRV